MFRMLQSCEREPSSKNDTNNNERLQIITNRSANDTSNTYINQTSDHLSNDKSTTQRENPHKYLLYKPSFGQFYAYISAAFKDLSPMRILMLYISADGFETTNKNQIDRKCFF